MSGRYWLLYGRDKQGRPFKFSLSDSNLIVWRECYKILYQCFVEVVNLPHKKVWLCGRDSDKVSDAIQITCVLS